MDPISILHRLQGVEASDDRPPEKCSPEEEASASSSSGVEGTSSAGREGLEVVGISIYLMLKTLVEDFEEKSVRVGSSQEQLSNGIDRLTRELDQLLEDAPVAFILQHGTKISGLCKRVSSLNTILRSIQHRVDNIDRMVSAGFAQGVKKEPSAKGVDPPQVHTSLNPSPRV